MTQPDIERRYSPLIILALVAALVLVIGLWSADHASSGVGTPANTGSAVSDSPAIEWKLVTTWPKNFPGLGRGPETFARVVDELSAGRLKISVHGAGEIVPAFGVFDAVAGGVAQAGHGASYYWKGKAPASVFFTAMPFGLTAQEMNGWLHYGGGLELWREVYAPFGIMPLAGGNTGVQMGGWFNKEINSVEDLKGLRMRLPGLAGEVLSATGGTPVTLPGSELYTALQTGVIDATEWVGPYNDIAFGLHQVAKYYYYPGWHEPGSTLEIIVNQVAYDGLPKDLQAVVTYAARVANADMLDEFTARNNASLQKLVNEHGVQLRQLPDDVFKALYDAYEIELQKLVDSDPMTAKVYDSYKTFLDGVRKYHAISEQAYINAREKALD